MCVRHDASVLVEVVEWPAKARHRTFSKCSILASQRPFHPAVVAATADADARLLGAEDSTSVRIERGIAALPGVQNRRHSRRGGGHLQRRRKRGGEGSAAAPAPSTSARRLTRGGERTTPQICTIASIGAAGGAGSFTSRFTPLAAISFIRDRLTPLALPRSAATGRRSAMVSLPAPHNARVRRRLPVLWSNRRDAALAVVNNPLIVQLGSGELPAGSCCG